jgi:hypothetical protein
MIENATGAFAPLSTTYLIACSFSERELALAKLPFASIEQFR